MVNSNIYINLMASVVLKVTQKRLFSNEINMLKVDV